MKNLDVCHQRYVYKQNKHPRLEQKKEILRECLIGCVDAMESNKKSSTVGHFLFRSFTFSIFHAFGWSREQKDI